MAEPAADYVVMVIEDTPEVQELLREALGDEGYRVLLAATGEAALDALDAVQPDVILCDLNLPGIGGVQLLQALRQRRGGEAVPLIVVSAQVHIAEPVRELVHAIVPKPFNLDELMTIIRELLPPKQTQLSQ
jgi:DNA-binding response OmpR family regulator